MLVYSSYFVRLLPPPLSEACHVPSKITPKGRKKIEGRMILKLESDVQKQIRGILYCCF